MTSQTKLPTNRKFGYFFATLLLALTAYLFYKNAFSLSVCVLLSISIFFYIASIKNSKILTPFNKVWFSLGQHLGNIFSPITLGIIFFVLITPTGLMMKLFGRDQLRLSRRKVSSYWVAPINSNFDLEFFRNQF